MTRIKTIIFYIFIFISLSELEARSQLTKFLIEHQYSDKLIVCALNPSDCRTCIIPLDEFFSKIKSINHNIKTLIFFRDTLTKLEEKLFISQLKVDTCNNLTELIVNSGIHQELLEKENGPMVGITNKARLISHYNLKDESLIYFFKDIAPELKISLLSSIQLINNDINPTKGIGSVVHIGSSTFLHTWNFNCISKYSANGKLLKNLFFDSLKLDYDVICNDVLSKSNYEKNRLHFEKKEKKENNLINLVTVINYQNDKIALCCNIRYFFDSLYENVPASYANESGFLVILDSNLTYQKIIPVIDYGVSFLEHGVQINNKFYFVRYDKIKKGEFLCEFECINDKLKKSNELPMPYLNSDVIGTICPLISDSNLISVAYSLGEKRRRRFELYELDFKQKKTNLILKLKNVYVHGPWIQKTKRNNYIFYIGTANGGSIRGFDRLNKRIVQLSAFSNCKHHNTDYYDFFEDGKLLRVISDE